MSGHVEHYPELAEHVGRYLVRYEPKRALAGEQWVWTTDDVSEARVFSEPTDNPTWLAGVAEPPARRAWGHWRDRQGKTSRSRIVPTNPVGPWMSR
jgi:hypothetical protein